MIQRRNVGPSFIDLLFIISLGFLLLLFVMLPFLNPIAKQGTIDPPVQLMVEMRWDDESKADIDLWIVGPTGRSVGYMYKSNGYLTLKRDDLGQINDRYTINGEDVVVKRNYEVATATVMPDGWYTINIHYFGGDTLPTEVFVKVTNLAHFKVAYDGSATITLRQEHTLVSFRVEDGYIVELDTTVQRKLRAGATTP